MGTCLQLFSKPDELIQEPCVVISKMSERAPPGDADEDYSFLGVSNSSITRLSKRPAPPPSILR